MACKEPADYELLNVFELPDGSAPAVAAVSAPTEACIFVQAFVDSVLTLGPSKVENFGVRNPSRFQQGERVVGSYPAAPRHNKGSLCQASADYRIYSGSGRHGHPVDGCEGKETIEALIFQPLLIQAIGGSSKEMMT